MSTFYDYKNTVTSSTAKEVVKCSDWDHQAWKALTTLFLQKLCKDIRYNQLTVASVDKMYDVTFQMKTLQQYSFIWSVLNFWPQKFRYKWGIKTVYTGNSLNIDGFLKPRANGQTIFGQQLPILLDVACCLLLGVVVQSLTHTNRHNIVGSCCVHLHKA